MTDFLAFLFIVLVGLMIVKLVRLGGKPKEGQVLDRWGAFLSGQAASGEEWLFLVEEDLDRRNPTFKKERITFQEGPKASGNTGQPAIKVSFSLVHNCFISYNTEGSDLYLSYAMHQRDSYLYAIPIFGALLYRRLNVIYLQDRNKLLAFMASTADCVKRATDTLAENLDLDRDQVKIKELSGKLGPL